MPRRTAPGARHEAANRAPLRKPIYAWRPRFFSVTSFGTIAKLLSEQEPKTTTAQSDKERKSFGFSERPDTADRANLYQLRLGFSGRVKKVFVWKNICILMYASRQVPRSSLEFGGHQIYPLNNNFSSQPALHGFPPGVGNRPARLDPIAPAHWDSPPQR